MNLRFVLAATAVAARWQAVPATPASPSPPHGCSPPGATPPQAPCSLRKRVMWVKVSGTITGLKPGAEHGFPHPRKGDCSSGDGMSAGGPSTPAANPRPPRQGEHHTGDLPSLKADATARQLQFESRSIRVGSTANDVVDGASSCTATPTTTPPNPPATPGPAWPCAVITANKPSAPRAWQRRRATAP